MQDDKINLRYLFKLSEDQYGLMEWLRERGMITNRYVCGKCGRNMKIIKRVESSDGYQWMCQKYGEAKHNVKRSIRKGTWFEESKLGMSDILIMTYMWCMKLGNNVIMSKLVLSAPTVVDWKRFCREICVEICMHQNEVLGGPGVIVEVDENKFGKRKHNRGRRVDGKWVFRGVERGTDKCFLSVVSERSENALLVLIKKYILPGTTIISNCWKAFNCLENEEFVHLTVNNSIQFKDPSTGAQNNATKGTRSAIKRNLNPNLYQLDTYVFEYVWRQRNKNKENLFLEFLRAVVQVYPPSTHD